MNSSEIEELKLLIEQKFGKQLSTTTDFNEFSLTVTKTIGIQVSASTLKRMWGYVSDSHKPRRLTLDTLARYLGHNDYHAFLLWLKTSTRYNSSFFSAEQLISNDVEPGATVEIGWSPNRLLRLSYLGDSLYEVTEAENSKLRPGDRFKTGCFIKEQPLYLPYIERGGGRTAPFIAGRNGGLTVINVCKNNSEA